MLKAVASLTGLKTMLDFLGDRFYGKNLPIKVEVNGNKYEFEYRTQEQLENAIAAIAEAIEAEVLQPYREYQDKLQEYEETLKEAIEAEYPLSGS